MTRYYMLNFGQFKKKYLSKVFTIKLGPSKLVFKVNQVRFVTILFPVLALILF